MSTGFVPSFVFAARDSLGEREVEAFLGWLKAGIQQIDKLRLHARRGCRAGVTARRSTTALRCAPGGRLPELRVTLQATSTRNTLAASTIFVSAGITSFH